ncbi:mediator complex subunit 27-domain-containing protein [Pyrenochaeta sp. MPI-SDFR-AT-0127]|nr:mediator complex subunit 27-domain-containing protein [Pyrenochaeta sp. MPI-SDFR-AT-0127]
MSPSDAAAQPGAGWDEAQCTAALAQLEQLQAQLDDLRSAIPRIIEPFHRPPNPTTFKLYAQGVIGSQNGIKSLNDQWKSPETQGVFEHVKKSIGANADLAASASIPSSGWVERERRERAVKNGGARTENMEEAGDTVTDEDISQIIVDFRKNFPKVKLETQDDNNTVSAQFVSGSAMCKFRISIEREANGRHKLNAECLGTTEPSLAITRCIASRPQASDLKYLLDMIGAYKNVKGLSCAKCGQLLDRTMLTPTARRSRQVPSANETLEVVWEAFHEGCL